MRQSLRRISTLALQNSQQGVDLIILRSQLARPLESLRRQVVISLPQGQNSPVCPTRGLIRHEFRDLRQLLLRVHVVANLQRRQPHIERRNNIRISLRPLLRKLRLPTATRGKKRAGRQQYKERRRSRKQPSSNRHR